MPDTEPWEFWAPYDDSNIATIDHSAWQSILDTYLVASGDGVNRFNYAQVTPADRALLQDYLQQLEAIDPRSYARAEQMAYWINLYNALTVEAVLDAYPVESIREIRSGLFAPGPWKREVAEVAGQPLSLDDIEHRILRPIWRDPRVHYAVNCASVGCPNLAAQAWSAAELESMLDAAATAFINHPRGASIDNDSLTLSSIYSWYGADFGTNRAELIAHLQKYARPELAQALRNYEGPIFYDYDWRLNAAP